MKSCRNGAKYGCVLCGDLGGELEFNSSWVIAYEWFLSRRRRNKEWYALHGNPWNSLDAVDVFDEDAQRGLDILRARATTPLALLGGDAINSINGSVVRDPSDGDAECFHECEEEVPGLTGAMHDTEFDMQQFWETGLRNPVISLAEALGLEAVARMDAACAKPADEVCSNNAHRSQPDCSRCGQRLLMDNCRDTPCILCCMPPTPGGQVLSCNQCGAQLCNPCGRANTGGDDDVGVIAGVSLQPSASASASAAVTPIDAASQPSRTHMQLGAGPSVRRRRRKRLCTGCGYALRGRMLDETERCTYCSVDICSETRVFECGPCGTTLCVGCAPLAEEPAPALAPDESNTQADELQVGPAAEAIDDLLAAAARQAGGVPDAHPVSDLAFDADPRQWSNDQVECLLRALRRCPEVCPLSGLRYPPRDLEQRWASVCVCIMEWHAEVCDKAAQSPDRRELADLLLHSLWAVFFRASGIRCTFSPEDDEKEQRKSHLEDYSSNRGVVRKRLELAEAGQWRQLIEDFSFDVIAAQTERRRRGADPTTGDDEWKRTAEQVILNTLDGNVKGAARKLRPSGIHPASLETFELVEAKFRTDAADDSLGRRPDLVTKARDARPARVTMRAVHKAVEKLQIGKAPGVSGWKASYVQPLLQHPRGLVALSAWTRLWVRGDIHESCAQRWRSLLVVPLKKGTDGSDVRAVLISEVLLSVPSRVLKAFAHPRLVKLFHPSQFGVGIAGGAEAMQLELDVRTRLRPDLALLCLDIANAFGEVTRESVLEQELEHSPEAARFTLTMWGSGTPAFVEVGPGEWRVLNIRDGLYIGEVRASHHFCLVMRSALIEFSAKCTALFGPDAVHHLEYIDDVYVHLAPHLLPQAWAILIAVLARRRLSLTIRKVGVWIPQETEGVNQFVQRIGIQQFHGSVTCLGGAMGGEFAFELGGQIADVPQPTLKRLDKARALAEAIVQLVTTETALPRLRAAWCLLQFVLNRALDFDARILHQAAFGQFAVEFDMRVEGIAISILGNVDTDSLAMCKRKLRILSSHGGGGLVTYADRSACGFLVAVRQIVTGVSQRLADAGYCHDRIAEVLALRVLPGCRACQTALADNGVHLLPGGGFGLGPVQPVVALGANVWLQAGPASKQADAIRLLSETRAASLGNSLSKSEHAHFLSAGGEGAGCWHAEVPATWQRPVWTDPVFRIALRFRLGLRVMAVSTNDEASLCACGAERDLHGRHALLCNRGPWTCGRHNSLVRILASIAKEAGYVVLVEQHVPQLGFRKRRRGEEVITEAARLDVVASCHPFAPDQLYDVSVRNPFSVRAMAKGAADHPGVAAGLALEDKQRRYPASGGVSVQCFAMETVGRIHPTAEEELQRLATLARDRLTERGIRPGAFLRKWRHQLHSALFRAIAATLLSSDGGCGDGSATIAAQSTEPMAGHD